MQFKKISLSVLLSLVVTLGVNAGHNEDQSQTKATKTIKKVKKVAPPSCDQGQAQPQAQDCSLAQSQSQPQQDCGQAAPKACKKETKIAETEESSSSTTSDSSSTSEDDGSTTKSFCGQNFSGHLNRKDFRNADCSNAQFTQLTNHNHHIRKNRIVRFNNTCNLLNSHFHDTSISMLRFRDADLTHTHFSNTHIGRGKCFRGAKAQHNGQTIIINRDQAKQISNYFHGYVQQDMSFEQMLQQANIH